MSGDILQEIANAFREGKKPRRALCVEFIRCYDRVREVGIGRAFKTATPMLPKGAQTTRAKNKPGTREQCLISICDLLKIRNCTAQSAIAKVAALNQVGKNQVQQWWRDGDNADMINIRKADEVQLFIAVYQSKRRYKKTVWAEQKVRKNPDGKIVLASLALIPKHK